ncbi:MAG TPA: glycosyltransferase [Vicinamibacterales bacterium]|jgi:glycosyltransferase involved in cell wall biosynthesis
MPSTGAAILYFASVYWDDPLIVTQQVAIQLARRGPILYVEPPPCSVYLRQPARNRRWLRAGRAPRRITDGLHVYTPPPVLPFKTRVAVFNAASQAWVTPFVRRAMRTVGIDRPVLFTYLPHLYASVGRYDERLVCYYCIDNMGALTRAIDPAIVAGYERRLLARTDVALTTSRGLAEKLGPLHRRIQVVPSGTDADLYARALDAGTVVAPELTGLPGPVIGFSGAVDFRLDQDLISEAARRRPSWSFVFVGPRRTSVGRLAAHPNIRFIPPQPQSALPALFKGFTVALIPYRRGPLVDFIYPTKLNDYLAAGVPVVSTHLPELEGVPNDIVEQVGDVGELLLAIERAMPTRVDEAHRARRVEFARSNSWECRARAIAAAIDRALAG